MEPAEAARPHLGMLEVVANRQKDIPFGSGVFGLLAATGPGSKGRRGRTYVR